MRVRPASIFGELFEALPGFQYASEPHLHELAALERAGTAIATKVPRADPDRPAPAGLPRSLAEMEAALDDPVIIWIVRHPLDAIASLRVGIADGWGHHPRPPDWERWLDRPLVVRCAHHWATINGPGWEAAARTWRASCASRTSSPRPRPWRATWPAWSAPIPTSPP